MSDDVTFSASTFEVVWEHSKLGDMPIVLYVPPTGFLEWERDEVVRDAWAELERKGLAQYGRPTDRLTELLAVLARPRQAVDARIALGKAGTKGSEIRGMAAARGDDGVLATLADGTVTIRTVFGTGIARSIVSLLPEQDAGPGVSVAVSREHIDPAAKRAGSSLYGFAEDLVERGVPGDQARMLVRMIEGTKRRGQFGAAVLDRDGRRRAAPRAVAFHDNDKGRYLMEDKVTSDGRVWTTVTPASQQLIVQRVQALLDGLTT